MVAFEERVRDPITGLPIELFAWEEVEKELRPVKIRYEKRKGKDVTIIENLPFSDDNIWNFLKEIKRILACGGTYKDGYILLQGDHRHKVARLLTEKWGISSDQIEVE
ncbi:MAG: stress response translation initiation inhibitor YciH [Candidatus Korarchaeum sp.]|jgi:translation initiation factor 1|nr:stress response translation initiation inhibitor YciH [Candidatus Korarchaeum sp.]